ncbi:MAG: MFS transporter [Kofleriaceae bacterium]
MKLDSRLDRRIWQLAFARTANTMGLSLVMTFLGIYIVKTRGYPAWLYGVVALTGNFAQSLSNAWAGQLSDRIGRKPLIVTSLFVRAAFIALLGVLVLLHAPIWVLAINLVITSALRGCFEPVSYALVADVALPEQRIAAFGLQRMGVNLGWAIGPALGGLLTIVMPYGAVFFIAAVGMLIAVFVIAPMEDPIRKGAAVASPPLRESIRAAWRDRTIRLLLLATFFAALLQTQMYATFSIFMTDELSLTKANVGVIYALNGGAVLLLQLPALALIRRVGVEIALPYSAIVTTIGYALIGAATGMAGCALAMLVITMGEVVLSPAHQTATAEIADPAQRGRTYGVIGFAQMLGVALAPLTGGVLLDAIGDHHGAMWLTIATLGLAQTLYLFAFVRRRAAR